MKITKLFLLSIFFMGSISFIPPAVIASELHDTLQILEAEKKTLNIYRVYFPNEDLARKASISFHNQLLESHYDKGYLIMELNENEIEKLKAFQFKIKPAKQYIKARNERLNRSQKALLDNALSSSIQSIPGYSCYETVEETLSVAQSMVTSHPNLAEFIDVGDSWEKTQNIGGYDIKVLVLTNQQNVFPKPKLFINSAIHAREYTTAPLNLDFARWLVNGYGTNADATWILDHHEIHLMLQTNPDGRKKAEAGSSWRKNTNQNYCGSSSSSRGADLNRNFSERWNITGGSGSSGNECSSTYRGPSPGSEPEIQAIENYVRNLWPDSRGPNDSDAAPLNTAGIHIDIHSYSELVLWPWGDKSSIAPNGAQMRTLGRKFAFFNGYMPQQSIGLYATDGTSDNISYAELGVAAFTFELGTSFFQNCSTYENTIKPNNLPALIYAAKVVRTPYITPSGPDTLSLSLSGNASTDGVPAGTNVSLTATVSDLRFSTRNGTETTQNIVAAEYFIDTPPWQAGAVAIPLSPADGSFNSKSEDVISTIDTSGLSVGDHIIYVRARDDSNTDGAISAIFLKINDSTPPPVTAAYSYNCNGLSCDFNANASGGNITSYSWSFGDSTSAQGSQVTHSFSSPGTYTVTLTVSDANGNLDDETKAITVSTGSPNELQNGIPVDGINGAQGDTLFYTMQVPENARNLSFEISGGSGDADLYIQFATPPSTSNYECRPYRNGNNEVCNINNPQVGTYHVMLRGYRAFSGVSLTGSYTVSNGGGTFERSNLSDNRGGWQHFTLTIPANTANLNVSIAGGSGDADLYVRQATQPTSTQYDCRPYRYGNNESCSFASPQASTWYVSIRAYANYSGVDLLATWE
ncbi:M14 family zinc carboxypeptidase [Aliikangiella sp. IMCC44653]